MLRNSDEYKEEMQQWGTGSAIQQGIQAATAAVQGLAGGNLAEAIAGGAAPYLAGVIKQTVGDDNPAANLMAHAAVNAALALAKGENAASAATGAAVGEAMGMIALSYYNKSINDLSEEEKQTVSALATLAAGLAGGLVGDSTANAVAAAQAGKTTIENNFLGIKSTDKLDEIIQKIENGDRSLATLREMAKLENANTRSDMLMEKFKHDPTSLSSAENIELNGYVRLYAAEMEAAYGRDIAQSLVNSLFTENGIPRTPNAEVMKIAGSFLNTWSYHESNASIGDAALVNGLGPLSSSVKTGFLVNTAIGAGANTAVQLSGDGPFSYVDMIMAGITAGAGTGKGMAASAVINMSGAAVGSGIKGENPLGPVVGAAIGTASGGKASQATSGVLGAVVDKTTTDVSKSIVGSITSEAVSNSVKEQVNKAVE